MEGDNYHVCLSCLSYFSKWLEGFMPIERATMLNIHNFMINSLVGSRTQTQNAAFFERKRPECKPWP